MNRGVIFVKGWFRLSTFHNFLIPGSFLIPYICFKKKKTEAHASAAQVHHPAGTAVVHAVAGGAPHWGSGGEGLPHPDGGCEAKPRHPDWLSPGTLVCAAPMKWNYYPIDGIVGTAFYPKVYFYHIFPFLTS